jgi:biopolymer transport protein ExbB
MIVALSIFQFIIHGGFFMYLLLICSIVSVATIIIRGMALKRDAVLPPAIWNEIEALPPGENERSIQRLKNMVQRDPSPLARVTEICLKHLDWPRSENVEAVQTRARHEVVRMEAGLVVLEVIVGIAPLLGLLGAVSGLVTVFGNLGASETVSDPRGLAKGISEALNTTIAGLAIAIPCLIAYSYFSKKVETLAAEMESLLSELLSKCYSERSRRKGRPAIPESTEEASRTSH